MYFICKSLLNDRLSDNDLISSHNSPLPVNEISFKFFKFFKFVRKLPYSSFLLNKLLLPT